ncbi:peroxidase [Nephila pilipes]|uniref:Peroxidase n=1 Tax=Nephila pilipes TaxID=299642 RepID=A0A8X6N9X8_NEPPI|nr:peroxidase [Nephila pilipes]
MINSKQFNQFIVNVEASCKSSSNESTSEEYKYGTSLDLIPEDPNECHDDGEMQCDPEYPYRRMNGTCNNLEHPLWGSANECYLRLFPAFYDGFDGERKSTKGGHLPVPRNITLRLIRDDPKLAHGITFMFTMFGQTVAHDNSLAPQESGSSFCCDPENRYNPRCLILAFSPDDPFYSEFNLTCVEINRTRTCDSCNTGNREQINAVTSALDLSIVYGVDDDRANSLRTNDGTGKMRINNTENGDVLPSGKDPDDIFCTAEEESQAKCFYSGDPRVNQHATLSSLQILYVREHNRIATLLKTMNPHWDDERLYQETRRINIAQYQHIVFKEYLPPLLGNYIMQKFDLSIQDGSAGSKYDPEYRLGIWNEHATGLFRIHSMVAKDMGYKDLRFKSSYSNPDLIWHGYMGNLIGGVCKVASTMYGRRYGEDVVNYLYQRPGLDYGSDLSSVDMQRGRDHGLAPYIHFVSLCSEGNVNITSFDDLWPRLMSKKHARYLEENYATVEDVDVWAGAQMEYHFPGSLLGHTAVCVIAKQFRVLKYGDRFFYEHEGEVPSFTPGQRETLKQSSLSNILCHNLNMTHIQRNTMLLPSDENPILTCDELPEMDLTLWKEEI